MLKEEEIMVDLFAGGGGASQGILMATGRDPDVAVNHDPIAVAMHAANHPGTTHLRQDVWQVPPRWACRGKPVGLLWASPDCTHHSKAKGSAPRRDAKVRDLAWVVEKWASEVRPRIICLENVEEFRDWGPLDRDGKVIRSQKGTTFTAFVRSLRSKGYMVEWLELSACDFGAPTTRKRLFLVARCDGSGIAWPLPTHGPSRAIPYRTAGEIIDWSLPCPSIFGRKKPLAEATLRRIAHGIRRYVIECAQPFIIGIDNQGSRSEPVWSLDGPVRTIVTKNKHAIIIPSLVQTGWGERDGQTPRSLDIKKPIGTIMAGGGKHALVSAFLAKHYGGIVGQGAGHPLGTVTTIDHHSLVACNIVRQFGASVGQDVNEPVRTIMPGGSGKTALVTSHIVKFKGTSKDRQSLMDPLHTIQTAPHYGEVRAFLMKYYGCGSGSTLEDPLHTLTTKDRMSLVTVSINGEPYAICDIGMRMLSPRELFRAQGFPDSYRIDIEVDGRHISKADQVRMCGNSVCPDVAAALVSANLSRTGSRGDVRAGKEMLQLNLFGE